MAMATPQALPAMKRPASYYVRSGVFLLITMAATMNTLALADHSIPPSTLEIYVHRKLLPPNATIATSASPSGNPSGFGTIFVVQDIVRKTAAPDSPILGALNGQVLIEKDGSIYVSETVSLNIGGFSGTISYQGASTAAGGEVAITGGTQDFRWARGYADSSNVFQDSQVRVFKIVNTIKYY